MNVWGEEIEIPGGVFRQWLPYKWSEETTDPVEKELARLEIYPGLPGRLITIQGKDTKLDEDIYRDYCITFGHEAKAAIAKIIRDPKYKAKTDEVKTKVLESIIQNYRNKHIAKVKASQRKRMSL